MVRFILSLMIVVGVIYHANANPQKSLDDLSWSDIGTEFMGIEQDERQLQQSYASNTEEGLLPIGSFILLKKDINLRKTPSGNVIKPVKKGKVYQVLNIQREGSKRFYQIRSGKDLGYIYAGTHRSYKDWTKQTWGDYQKEIPQIGDKVKIKRKKGVPISQKPGHKSFYKIPKNAEAQVESIESINGKVFLRLSYRSKMGYVSFEQPQKEAQTDSWAGVY